MNDPDRVREKLITSIAIENRGIPNTALTRTGKAANKHSIWNRPSFAQIVVKQQQSQKDFVGSSSTARRGDPKSHNRNFDGGRKNRLVVQNRDDDEKTSSVDHGVLLDQIWSNTFAVTIMFGTNDCRNKIWGGSTEFEKSLWDLIQTVREHLRKVNRKTTNSNSKKNKKIFIFLLTPPVASEEVSEHAQQAIKRYGVNKDRLIDEVIPSILRIGKTVQHQEQEEEQQQGGSSHTKLVLIDTFSYFDKKQKELLASGAISLRDTYYFLQQDGIHLSEAGSRDVAKLIANAMKQE
jgi:hypothetical protein